MTPRASAVRVAKSLALLVLVTFLGYGVWAYTRLPERAVSGSPQRYGTPPPATEHLQIAQAVHRAQREPAEARVTLEGAVVDMGPTMGCWLLVQDGTGEVLIQTDPMIYMPQTLRGARVRVTGALVHGRFRGMGYGREGWFLFSRGVEVVRSP